MTSPPSVEPPPSLPSSTKLLELTNASTSVTWKRRNPTPLPPHPLLPRPVPAIPNLNLSQVPRQQTWSLNPRPANLAVLSLKTRKPVANKKVSVFIAPILATPGPTVIAVSLTRRKLTPFLSPLRTRTSFQPSLYSRETTTLKPPRGRRLE